MKKLAYVGYGVLVALGLNCSISNYILVTDNDQLSHGPSSHIVNTNGKAKLRGLTSLGVIWPDGHDEYIDFVDQKANGDRTLYTYNNFSTHDEFPFHSDLYCSTEWQGCAIFVAPDPETGDVDPFDGRLNTHCKGARSYTKSISTGRYYGECGRARVPLVDRLALANMGRIGTFGGMEGLWFDLDGDSLSIRLDNHEGDVVVLRLVGDAVAFVPGDGLHNAVIDATNPLLAGVGRGFARYLRDHGTGRVTSTFTYNGISVSFEAGGENMTASNVLALVNRKY